MAEVLCAPPSAAEKRDSPLRKVRFKECELKSEMVFEYADAWLLLSIIYANQHNCAKLSDIIAWGDAVNRAIFSLEELQGGLFRLINTGYVAKRDDEFVPTDKIMQAYMRFTKKGNLIFDELQFVSSVIKSPEWSSGYDPSKANKNGSLEEITKERFEVAYREYVQTFKNISRESS